jgi:hypothetical protein
VRKGENCVIGVRIWFLARGAVREGAEVPEGR